MGLQLGQVTTQLFSPLAGPQLSTQPFFPPCNLYSTTTTDSIPLPPARAPLAQVVRNRCLSSKSSTVNALKWPQGSTKGYPYDIHLCELDNSPRPRHPSVSLLPNRSGIRTDLKHIGQPPSGSLRVRLQDAERGNRHPIAHGIRLPTSLDNPARAPRGLVVAVEIAVSVARVQS